MEWHGFMGQYIRVNLTDREITIEDLDPDFARQYVGGNGFGVKILIGEVGPEVAPLSPDNKIVFATGPLVGTEWTSSGRGEVISKSPLTGIYGDSNAGGMFPAFLKFSGYDFIIVEGKTETPVYLYIHGDELEINEAGDLWGQDTLETEALLKEEHSPSTRVASIGPAGENLVKYASITSSPQRSFGRSGMGAVMGSKKLKAIAVNHSSKPSIADPDQFPELASTIRERLLDNPGVSTLARYGTSNLVPIMDEIGRFPTKNSQLGSFDQSEEIGPEALRKYVVNDKGCFGCPIRCDKDLEINEGEFEGTRVESVEYETLSALGSGIMDANFESILKANDLCDRLGMDTISAGKSISMAMELYEKGIIDEEDTGGLSLEWSDYHVMLELVEKIAHREGFGDILAEGVKSMAEHFGPEAKPFAMEVKGQEIPSQDGRAQQSMGLAHVTSTRGADHLKALPTVDETGSPEAVSRRYGDEYLPEMSDPQASRYKPFLVKDGEDFGVIVDSVGMCKLAGTHAFAEVYWGDIAKGLSYATGFDYTVEELKFIGERNYNLMRIYNGLHGIDRNCDMLPDRFVKEPSPSGNAEGSVCRLPEMLEEYYDLRGWDQETGLPTEDTLERLNLEEIVEKTDL